MRLAGMTLPGKHAGPPVVALQFPGSSGSRMKTRRPWLSNVCEKSPRRSSARRHPSLIQSAGIGAGEPILREEEEQFVALRG